jgi:hypothetical protein
MYIFYTHFVLKIDDIFITVCISHCTEWTPSKSPYAIHKHATIYTSKQYIAHLRQVSQLKIYYFSGERFKGFEVLYFSVSAKTTQLLSNGEFCKLRYDTISGKLHLQTFRSIPITQKCQILCDTLVANERYLPSLLTNIIFLSLQRYIIPLDR